MSDTLFRAKAPGIMRLLMQDFDLRVEDAAAILGNLGHESGGFRFLQEKKPLVKGSRGGWGWAQWTGPRRRAFEAYVARNDLDPASDKANYGWLFVELSGPEAKAIPAVKKAKGLEAKVIAFEKNFERAGVKHYPSRLTWAKKALAAYQESEGDIDEGMAEIAKKLAPKTKPKITVPEPMLRRASEIAKSEIVGDVQTFLREVGFPEVGNVDGKIGGPGSRTRGAISSYRAARGLPLSEDIDDELMADLAAAVNEGWKRPISVERATATKEDLVDTSAVLQNTDRAKRHMSIGNRLLAWLGIGGTAAGSALEIADTDQLETRLSFVQRIGAFAWDNLWIALPLAGIAGAMLYTYYAQRRVDEAEFEEVQGHREARHV